MKRTLLIIYLITIWSVSNGQFTKLDVDTIYCNSIEKTVVIFDNKPVWGMPGVDAYEAAATEYNLFIRALDSLAPPSNMTIYFGEKEYKQTIIAYKKNLSLSELNVDLTTHEAEEPNNAKQTILQPVNNQKLKVHERMGYLMGSNDEPFKKQGSMKDDLTFKLVNVLQDNELFYIKTLFSNRSRTNYNIDYLNISYVDGNDELSAFHQADVVSHIRQDIVKSKEYIYLVHCIEKINLGKDGEIELTMREESGTRMISFKVKYEDFLNAKTCKL